MDEFAWDVRVTSICSIEAPKSPVKSRLLYKPSVAIEPLLYMRKCKQDFGEVLVGVHVGRSVGDFFRVVIDGSCYP